MQEAAHTMSRCRDVNENCQQWPCTAHCGKSGFPGLNFGGMSRKRISQETFDAAVKENMDDFGLSAEEAVRDTIKEFELQASPVPVVKLVGFINAY